MTPPLLVIAKAPVPGAVKTRLCPPCTLEAAARIAEAALLDTLDSAGSGILVLSGDFAAPPGWATVAQRGDGLDERLCHAFHDAGSSRHGALLIGMDTPQVTGPMLATLAGQLRAADAVLAPAADGGWWALGLRDVADAEALLGVPMSRPTTQRDTLAALQARGLRVHRGPVLRDVDTAADAHAVAAVAPAGRFAAAVATLLPREVPV
jgi:glycosyltransferase A (GT-A) superfamily protein (DUF2064 family)